MFIKKSPDLSKSGLFLSGGKPKRVVKITLENILI